MATTTISSSKLNTILIKNIGLSPNALDGASGLTLVDLGVDSIGVIELEKVLFNRYGIELPEHAAVMTIDQILNYVNHPEGSLQR